MLAAPAALRRSPNRAFVGQYFGGIDSMLFMVTFPLTHWSVGTARSEKSILSG
jgi:hypothetical protein